MVRFNPRRNTLERQEHVYTFQDPAEPQLYRDIFPYDRMPRVTFNYRVVPMNPPDQIWITDTTFRDGQQAFRPFSTKQIVDLYRLLHKLSGPKGLIRQSEFFIYTDRDRKAVEECLSLGYRYPEVTSWIRARKEDFKLVHDMGLRETGILMSCSDYHIFYKFKKRRREVMDEYLGIVEAALANNVTPRCHLEDVTRADFYGFVVPFAQKLMDLAAQGRATVKVRLCDTLGLGVTYPGVSLPISVQGIVYGMRHYAEVPAERLEWHGHNDFYRAVDNASAAWLYGASAANGTLMGIGERSGNTPIEGLVVEYLRLRGGEEVVDTRVLADIADYFEKEIGYRIPPNQPIVGSDIALTRAGIHADAIGKFEEIYNIFDTEKLLKRPIRIAVSSQSGAAGICEWANGYFKLADAARLAKTDPGVLKIKEWVDAEYAGGRTTTISDDELAALAKQHLGLEAAPKR